jgi:catechol 2,3-dioxygenase-like lactoylglutathione lyase family enzyme
MEVTMPSAVHISLNVSDLSRSTDFYQRFFGEPKKLKSDYVKFVARDPEIHLALQPGRVGGRLAGAVSHLGIRVDSAEQVRRWKSALTERGLPTEEEKREACCYALQEKFWVTDPDGNRWEVYTVLEDIEQKAEGGTTCCTPKAETGKSEVRARDGACAFVGEVREEAHRAHEEHETQRLPAFPFHSDDSREDP